MKVKIGIVYKITCVRTAKSYIGYATTTLDKRWKRHCYDTKCGSDVYFHRAIRKYGPAVFVREVIHTCSVDILKAAEVRLIKKHGTLSPDGYNLTLGGDGGGYGHRTKRERKAIGAKIGAANTGKKSPKSLEHRKRISESLTGRVLSKKECRAHSLGLVARYAKEGEREKTRQATLAHHATAAGKRTRRRQSEAAKRRAATGNYFSKATIKKLSDKAKAQHARQRMGA